MRNPIKLYSEVLKYLAYCSEVVFAIGGKRSSRILEGQNYLAKAMSLFQEELQALKDEEKKKREVDETDESE